MREDVARQEDLGKLGAAESRLTEVLRKRDWAAVGEACDGIYDSIRLLMPPKSHSAFRENL